MDYLPIFADLKKRMVLVVGGGEIAARKITLLLRAGATVQVVARTLCSEVSEHLDNGRLSWLAQEFSATQITAAFLVIAATDDTELNNQVFREAENMQRLVNVVDDKARCSFIFPSIVDRSPVVVAISSAGSAPVLVRQLRQKLEIILPQYLGSIASMAGQWRGRVQQVVHNVTLRRRFWERVFSGRFVSLMACGQQQAAEQYLQQELSAPVTDQGEIYLVGAGPGDAGLLTIRGSQVLQLADFVLYDHLVSDEVLELVRRDATRICVGKRAGAHSVAQQQINRMLVELAQQGHKVVRLKGGDPFIFGRGAEELQAAVAANIPFQVVPGITAAAGATAYAGIPLTHRDYAQSAVFITGHCRPDGSQPDWPSLAISRQTLAIYMGTVKASEISQQLIAHGRDPATPVAIISRGTRSDQQVRTGHLSELGLLASDAVTPALVVVGEVAALHHQLTWFGRKSALPEQSVVQKFV